MLNTINEVAVCNPDLTLSGGFPMRLNKYYEVGTIKKAFITKKL